MQYSVTWWHVTGRAASWCLHVYDSDVKVKSLQPSFLCVAWPGHAPAPSGYSKSSHMSNVLITSSLGSFMFRWWRQQWHVSFSSLKWQCVPVHLDCVFMSLYLGRMVNIRSAVWFCFLLWKSFRTREISLYMVFYFESSPASLIYYSAKLPPLMSSASHWTSCFSEPSKICSLLCEQGKTSKGKCLQSYTEGIPKKLRRSKTKQETWEPKITK